MDVRARRLAAQQDDLVAGWQLRELGVSQRAIDHRVEEHDWHVVHAGVYAVAHAPLTQRQRWVAAVLSEPGTVLSHASAGACWGFRAYEGGFETVTRHGSGGPRRIGDLVVFRSTTLEPDIQIRERIRLTSAARTALDLAPSLTARETARMFREALRVKATSMRQMRDTLARHRGRRGVALLAQLARRYADLPSDRTRSNAEARALEVLHDAGVPPPQVNTRISGEEADLAWPALRLIMEIDGPQFHRFRDEDARKEACWRAAGYTVRRLPSDDVYTHPIRLLDAFHGRTSI